MPAAAWFNNGHMIVEGEAATRTTKKTMENKGRRISLRTGTCAACAALAMCNIGLLCEYT